MSGNNGKGGISVRVHVSSGWISIDWRFRFTGRNQEMVDFISCGLMVLLFLKTDVFSHFYLRQSDVALITVHMNIKIPFNPSPTIQ
jgi:hypothetical protein